MLEGSIMVKSIKSDRLSSGSSSGDDHGQNFLSPLTLNFFVYNNIYVWEVLLGLNGGKIQVRHLTWCLAQNKHSVYTIVVSFNAAVIGTMIYVIVCFLLIPEWEILEKAWKCIY